VGFVVDPSPTVLQAVSRLSPTIQRFFRQQVLAILSEDPYRFRDVILRHIAADGRAFYTYYDGIVPLVFVYRVYPGEQEWERGAPGYGAITGAEQPWW
jgi:hypothetical protein